MIRHAFAEGWLLLRQRGGVSLTLALALAVPLGLAGTGLALWQWLGPLVERAQQDTVVAILLHPHLDPDQRSSWISAQASQHPEWRLRVVEPEELADRLVHWFPYLEDLLAEGGDDLLPPLVEITTSEPAGVDALAGSPAVIAVGPRTSVQRILTRIAGRMAVLVALITAVLLAAAVLLAMVWVHLELYRHSDEIVIMRLMGATEAAIRGPFLVAVAVPASVAAAMAALGAAVLVSLASDLTTSLGLPVVHLAPRVMVVQVVLGFGLPLGAAILTLARHGQLDLDG